MIYVEGKADEALVIGLGLTRQEVSRELNKDEVLKQLARQTDCRGMVDEDPNSPQPIQLSRMIVAVEYDQLGLRVYDDTARHNRVILLRPRLEEWLLRAAGDAGLDVGGRRYNLPSSPTRLHREINLDLRKVERLLVDLLAADAPRLRELRRLLGGQTE